MRYDYPLIQSVKLKNLIHKLKPESRIYYRFELKNISINGVKKGCSGFITNTVNKKIVYINTESIFTGYLRRYARNTKDYTGGINHYSNDPALYAYDIIHMLENTEYTPIYPF